MSGFFERTRPKLKLSGGLLEGLRHNPVVAAAIVQAHVNSVEVQVVHVTTNAGISTRGPVGTVGTKGGKLTTVVIAQRREEEIFSNLAIRRLAILGRNAVVTDRSTHIFTIGICLL